MRSLTELIRGIARRLKRAPDTRPESIQNIDANATRAASTAQTVSDAGDRAAGAPADQGGEA